MNTEERDDSQARPQKVTPNTRRENTDQDGERRPYNQGYNKPEGNNYERRPYRSYGENNNRPSYGDRQGRRPYDNGDGGYGNRPSYGNRGDYGNNREGGYNNNRSAYGNNRSYGDGQSYNRQRPSYNNAPGKAYSASPSGDGMPNEGVKKRRPRVGDARVDYNDSRSDNGVYNTRRYNNDNSYGNQGGYGNNRQGGYNNNRQGGYGNNNRQGGYNNNRQGGYGNNNRQGGYGNNNNRRPQQGGYGNNNRRPQGNNRPQGRPNPRPKQIKYKELLADPNEPIRLNKFLANAGVCSRREADEYIQKGVVKVNGEVITELGTKITRQDQVTFNDKPVQIESKIYIVLNKPKNCVTTSDDPQERLTVMDLVKNACQERIYPVGRLDRNTTGVLLLTNDGDLASKLTHPSFKKKKIYHVWLDKNVAIEDMEKIANGLELEDGEIHADAISYASEDDKSQVGIEIHSGRNRIVRRIFESLGYHVTKLDRVYFAGLTKKNLGRGKWRYLNEKEVNALRMGAFE